MVDDILNSISSTFSNFDAFENEVEDSVEEIEQEVEQAPKKEEPEEKNQLEDSGEVIKHGPTARDFLLKDLLEEDWMRL